MSDLHRRRAERAAAGAAGDLGARARLLQGRLRAGEVSPGQVALAAHLGDAVAREVARQPPPPDDLYAWLIELRAHGQRVWVQALLALLEACGDEVVPVETPLDDSVHRLAGAVRGWLDDPGPAGAARVEATWAEAIGLWGDAAPWPLRGLAAHLVEVIVRPFVASPPGVAIACADPPALLADLRQAGARARLGGPGEVVLEDVGRRKMVVAGAVRAAAGGSLRDAKRLVDAAEGTHTPLRYLDGLVPGELLRERVREALLPDALG